MKPWNRILPVLAASTILFSTACAAGTQSRPKAAQDNKIEAERTALPESKWPVPMPEKWITHYLNRVEEFKRENAALSKDRKNIVFVGDSLTEGFPLEEFFPGRPLLNRGIISDGIGFDERGVLGRMDSSVFDCNPGIVFLTIGVNDLPHEWVTVEECVKGYRTIVEKIQKRLPDTKLVLQTLAPTGEVYKRHAYLNPRIEEFNKHLAALAEERSFPLIDLHALYRDENGLLPPQHHRGDGLHLKKGAYALWAKQAEKYLD